MTDPTRPRVTLKLSRREQEIVRGFAGILTQLEELKKEDARKQIMHEMVEHRFGSYTPSRERMILEPNWDKVFSLRACPNCNPLAENTGRLMPDGETMECRNCHYKTTQKTFDSARESREKEIGWIEGQEKLTEKISKYGMPEKQVEKLLTMAEQRAEAELRKRAGGVGR